jgi:hypothetical protein
MQDNPTVQTCAPDSRAFTNTQGASALLQRQKQFTDYLVQVTPNKTDLPTNFSQWVAGNWSSFYNSDCGAPDPTCDGAHEALAK